MTIDFAYRPLCPQGPVDDIDGYLPDQHAYVQGPIYVAPNPEDGQPANWEDLVCEKCGWVFSGWRRITP